MQNLESRIAECKDVMPLCKQLVRLGIGLGEFLAFHTAVSEKAGAYRLSMGTAAYRVIEDIRDYNNLGGIKKQLADIGNANIHGEFLFDEPV